MTTLKRYLWLDEDTIQKSVAEALVSLAYIGGREYANQFIGNGPAYINELDTPRINATEIVADTITATNITGSVTVPDPLTLNTVNTTSSNTSTLTVSTSATIPTATITTLNSTTTNATNVVTSTITGNTSINLVPVGNGTISATRLFIQPLPSTDYLCPVTWLRVQTGMPFSSAITTGDQAFSAINVPGNLLTNSGENILVTITGDCPNVAATRTVNVSLNGITATATLPSGSNVGFEFIVRITRYTSTTGIWRGLLRLSGALTASASSGVQTYNWAATQALNMTLNNNGIASSVTILNASAMLCKSSVV